VCCTIFFDCQSSSRCGCMERTTLLEVGEDAGCDIVVALMLLSYVV
jgi:hypothetical protein